MRDGTTSTEYQVCADSESVSQAFSQERVWCTRCGPWCVAAGVWLVGGVWPLRCPAQSSEPVDGDGVVILDRRDHTP